MKVAILAIAIAIFVQGCGGGGGSTANEDLSLQHDFSDPYKPVIAGVTFECRDQFNRKVVFAPDPLITDVGFSIPELTVMNPRILATMPPALQYFWVGHECAHHTNGDNDSEVRADCVSMAMGKQSGLFTRRDVEAFEPWFASQTGSSRGHLPGPERFANLLVCYDAA